jgi:pimeloyl-ACP methyl ester carboxylesterase
MPFFPHDGLSFHYLDVGAGVPFVFQHGLGGDVNQPVGLCEPPVGCRFLALDCRAHGQTRPLGDPGKISIAAFADDLAVFLDYFQIRAAVIGGISLGAALALNFALRFPQRVLGLILSRPAWLDGPMPRNVSIYGFIARLIRQHGAVHGLVLFRQSEEFQSYLRESPDAANSLVGQFQNPRAEETVVKLERIPMDTPVRDLAVLKSITVPTLILANRQDPIHPYEYGQVLATAIPGAEFRELTPKSVSQERHRADVQWLLGAFLRRHFLKE